jgi:hypothetical protein
LNVCVVGVSRVSNCSSIGRNDRRRGGRAFGFTARGRRGKKRDHKV